jgi:ribosomal protein S4
MQKKQKILKFYKKIEVDLFGNFIFKKKKNKVSTLLLKELINKKKFDRYKYNYCPRGRIFIYKRKRNYKFKSKRYYSILYPDRKYLRYVTRRFFKRNRHFIYRIDLKNTTKVRKSKSRYKINLLDRLKLKKIYNNLKERYLRKLCKKTLNLYKKNIFKKFTTLDIFFQLLESRLDIIIFRSYFASTIFEANQLINHRFITVNNKIMTFANYLVNSGDILGLTSIIHKFKYFEIRYRVKHNLLILPIPKYLIVNYKIMKIIFLAKSFNIKTIPYSVKFNLRNVFEYYLI